MRTVFRTFICVLALSPFLPDKSRGQSCAETEGPEREEAQRACFTQTDSLCHHIIAVDADGNALMPWVKKTTGVDGPTYQATTEKLFGEDTRGAKIDNSTAASFNGRQGPADNPAARNVFYGRKQLYLYLDAMFKAIESEKPDEVVVHVHGGLCDINGAVAKTALISDALEHPRAPYPPDHRIFYIGICWDSDFLPTYTEHLFAIREGLRQPVKAFVTLPAMLLSDIGGAASRMPLDLINFLYQDLYTVNPSGFKRTQLAQTRFDQIRAREELKGTNNSLVVSSANNQGSAPAVNAGLWLLTQPTKIASAFLLDWLGSEPWKNMLRRTRTMFERESEFIPQISYRTAINLAISKVEGAGQKVSPEVRSELDRMDQARPQSQMALQIMSVADKLLEQMNATGRQGAVALFCDQAQSRLLGAKRRPVVTLIGHSMGSIVSCEILERYHQLALDNVVFLGAACSIRDVRTMVIPYLQEQNLREKIREQTAGEIKGKLLSAMHEQGASAASFDAVQEQCYAVEAAPATPKTHFYDLCLHDTVENGEKNPGEADLVQRGSLLTWIDVLYQKPESENDRTFGRWVNAILATDSFPNDVVDRIAIKEFGVDRPLTDQMQRLRYYAYRRSDSKFLEEPMQHGDFARFDPGWSKETTNLAYWRQIYRMSEEQPVVIAPKEKLSQKGRVSVRAKAKGVTAFSAPKAAATHMPPPSESTSARNARTGF